MIDVENYSLMLKRVAEMSTKDTIIGSSNFDIFMNHLSNDDHKWIEDINEAIEAIDS